MVGTLRAASALFIVLGRCTQFPNVAMGIATLTRHRLTSQSIFQGPRSPYITEREQILLYQRIKRKRKGEKEKRITLVNRSDK